MAGGGRTLCQPPTFSPLNSPVSHWSIVSNLKKLRLGRQLICRPHTLTEQVNTLMAPHLNTNVSPHQVSDGYIRLVLLLDVVVVVDVVDVPPRRRLVVDVVDVSSVL